MSRTAQGNDDLLLLGGAGLLAVLLFSGVLNKGTGGGSGSSQDVPYYGTDGAAPVIYQLPGSGDVKFPDSSDTGDLAALLAMLMGGNAGTEDAGGNPAGATKKETVLYDAGQVLPDGTVIKKPFTSATTSTPASASSSSADAEPWWLRALNLGAAGVGGLSLLNPVTAPLAGLGFLDLAGAAMSGSIQSKKEALAKEGFGPEVSKYVPQAESLPAAQGTAQGTATKKESTSQRVGNSGQYVVDPVTGLLKWSGIQTPNGEYAGLSMKDGKLQPYQSDVTIFDSLGRIVYQPGMDLAKAMTVADAQGYKGLGGTGTANPAADAYDTQRAAALLTKKGWLEAPSAFNATAVMAAQAQNFGNGGGGGFTKKNVTMAAAGNSTTRGTSVVRTVFGGSGGFGGGGAGGR